MHMQRAHYYTGLTVRERNYLEVFPYDKWSDKELPQFQEGETFVPTECRLDEGKTSKPKLLTEADLVSIMDEQGIGMCRMRSYVPGATLTSTKPGTDATIAQHIQTIIDRGYVHEKMQGSTKYLIPSKLGIGLVEGYDAIGFDQSLSKPELRREVRAIVPSSTTVLTRIRNADRASHGRHLSRAEEQASGSGREHREVQRDVCEDQA